jgi:hypothetical protein
MWRSSLSNHWRPALERRLFLSKLSARQWRTVSRLVRGGPQPVHLAEWTAHRVQVLGAGRQELLRRVRHTARVPARGRSEHNQSSTATSTNRSASPPGRRSGIRRGFHGRRRTQPFRTFRTKVRVRHTQALTCNSEPQTRCGSPASHSHRRDVLNNQARTEDARGFMPLRICSLAIPRNARLGDGVQLHGMSALWRALGIWLRE